MPIKSEPFFKRYFLIMILIKDWNENKENMERAEEDVRSVDQYNRQTARRSQILREPQTHFIDRHRYDHKHIFPNQRHWLWSFTLYANHHAFRAHVNLGVREEKLKHRTLSLDQVLS